MEARVKRGHPSCEFAIVFGGFGAVALLLATPWLFDTSSMVVQGVALLGVCFGVWISGFNAGAKRTHVGAVLGICACGVVMLWIDDGGGRFLLAVTNVYGAVVLAAVALDGQDRLRAAALDESERAGRCPACGYDIRGIPRNRCPECGADIRLGRTAE